MCNAFKPLTVYSHHQTHVPARQAGTYLVDKVLAMIVTEFLSPNYSMAARGVSGRRKAPGKGRGSVQIRLHEFLDKIHLLKIFKAVWSDDIENRDDILVSSRLDSATGTQGWKGREVRTGSVGGALSHGVYGYKTWRGRMA